MSNVRDLIVETMNERGMRQYVGQAAPVIEAIEARDSEIAETLLTEGRNLGAREDQVRDLLIEVGLMSRPTPVSVSNGTSAGGDEDRLARMERNIEALLEVARSRGLMR